MAASTATKLEVELREPDGSRATRRLRRTGRVPGVVYGGGEDPVAVDVDARVLRQALSHGGAVIDLSVGGEQPTAVVLKDQQRDPVTSSLVHVDFLRVRLDRPIHATTVIELIGIEDAPGVKEGGTLEQVTREINVEALPTAIPDAIEHDVSAMDINDTVMLRAIAAPEGVTLLDDLEETVVATLSPPRVEEEPEPEIPEETELVGEEGAPAEGEAAAEASEGAAGGEGESGGE